MILLKYINEDTRFSIAGSIVGAEYEWFLHNIHFAFTGDEASQHVNLSKSIFRDSGHREKGLGMKASYIFLLNPVFWKLELIIGGGWGDDWPKKA